MTVELGRFKRGDDKQFRDIVVAVDGSPQDLTADGWAVRCQFRRPPYLSAVVVPVIDAGALADSIVRLSLPRASTETMQVGSWQGDVEVTGPEGRQSSATFLVAVVEDVTKDV